MPILQHLGRQYGPLKLLHAWQVLLLFRESGLPQQRRACDPLDDRRSRLQLRARGIL